ncbi:hypothetical protein VNI00_006034 [Paramarasmius palmivorus]|uniref:Cytochrome P450 n=1 Tax=Paramarasmius palmivorus TaxID=297713 RepID=A0AAW0DG11_9AGAR
MPYGDTWRQHRRKFQEGFRDLAQSHRPIQSAKTHELLVNLLRDPNNFRAHIRTLAAATIFGIVYGHDVASTNDYFVELAEKAVGALVTQGPLSAAIVNVFPFMRHLPAWFPGCGFHRTAQEGRRLLDDMVEKPYAIVVNEIASGTHKTSLLATYLEQNQISSGGEEKVLMIKQVCSTTYGAGADTLVSALATFFMAMASHPHAQKKAQEHIDNLIAGEDRLPTWEDRPNLQYIEAVMRETLRYGPVAPLGFFHSAVRDDVVNGAMTRDPTVYPDPENFIPERFLKEDGTCNDDDVSFTFGFGQGFAA